jgi:hypothetical protein
LHYNSSELLCKKVHDNEGYEGILDESNNLTSSQQLIKPQ